MVEQADSEGVEYPLADIVHQPRMRVTCDQLNERDRGENRQGEVEARSVSRADVGVYDPLDQPGDGYACGRGDDNGGKGRAEQSPMRADVFGQLDKHAPDAEAVQGVAVDPRLRQVAAERHHWDTPPSATVEAWENASSTDGVSCRP